MRQIDEIILHCADTRPSWMQYEDARGKVQEIRRWHVQDNGWSDIGYHFVIDRDGTVVEGRPLEKAGAHVRGHNEHSIGICLLGGHGSQKNDRFEDNFTAAQDSALRHLIQRLKIEHPEIRRITGHNEYANKACPGFDVHRWLTRTHVADRTSPTQSKTVQASAVQIASGTGAAVSAVAALDGYAQLAVIGFAAIIVVAGMFIMRERLRAWAAGWK